MGRIVRGGLVQCTTTHEGTAPIKEIKAAMIEKNIAFLEKAAAEGCQVVCLQEIFYGPYFPAEQNAHWYGMVESIPDGPTIQLMCETAKRLGMVLIVPIYEVEQAGVYYNAAAVIDADGKYLGKYRKSHIPHCEPGFWEKFYFRPGNLGYPVFETAVGKIGVYICYDRHFPEGARCLGLNGAEIVFNPSATHRGLSEYLWSIEQPAAAVANMYYVGAINRVGIEPLGENDFYGQSYFIGPRGEYVGDKGSPHDPELIVREFDLDLIREVRDGWQFYRDRRPEAYGELVEG
jgi:beta-ureidopropionase